MPPTDPAPEVAPPAWRVWKFPLEATETVIEAPMFARPLSVQIQAGKPCLWMLVSDRFIDRLARLRFRIYATGDAVPEGSDYVGTYQVGPLVWHLFRVYP